MRNNVNQENIVLGVRAVVAEDRGRRAFILSLVLHPSALYTVLFHFLRAVLSVLNPIVLVDEFLIDCFPQHPSPPLREATQDTRCALSYPETFVHAVPAAESAFYPPPPAHRPFLLIVYTQHQICEALPNDRCNPSDTARKGH